MIVLTCRFGAICRSVKDETAQSGNVSAVGNRGGITHCLVFSLCAGAQSLGGEDAMSLSLEELTHAKVFSASRHLEDSRQAPSSVSTISSEEIRRYGWRTLGDALRSLRGFYTSYDRDYTYLGVRGFLRPGDYNSRVLLLLNGHRLNDNVFDSAMVGTEFPLDLDLVDHIEVVRGPSSSMFGTNAVLAVINAITRCIPSSKTVELSGDTGSFLERTGRITSTFRHGKLSGLVSGSLYRNPGQARLYFSEFDTPETNNGWADGVDADRSGKVFADLQYEDLRIQGVFSTRTKLIPTGSYQANFNDSTNRSTDSRAFIDLSYHRTVSLGDLDVHATYDWYDFLGTGAFGGPDVANRYYGKTWAGANWIGAKATLDRTIGRHRMIIGADYEYSINVNQENEIIGQPAFFTSNRQPSRAALFGEGELNLIAKLSVRAGARLDWFNIYGISLSPRLAFVYSPNPRTALKYIYGQAFRAPNAYENHYTDGIVLVAPASPLKPEKIGSHEIIFERGLSPWLQMTLDGSYNHLRDLIGQVPDPSSGLTHFVNVGRDSGRELEMELAARRPSGLAVRASYTLADSTDGIKHDRLDNSPMQMVKANGTLPLTRYGLAGLEVLYTSGQDTYQETRVQPSLLTNATLSTRPIFAGWEFSASCYNAFNRRWYSPAGPDLQQSEIQQDGRTFAFKISHRFSSERASK
jgi:outer membrane receptor for ferrienterochelin and colicins